MSPEQSLNLVTSHIFYLNSQKEIIQISSTISATFCKICRLPASDRSNLKAQNTQVCLAISSFKVAGITWLLRASASWGSHSQRITKDSKPPWGLQSQAVEDPGFMEVGYLPSSRRLPVQNFIEKWMKVYGPVFIIIVLSSPQMEANIW